MAKAIPLTQGYEALVDDEDYERLSKHKWRIELPSLDIRRIGDSARMVWQIISIPPYLEADHRNGNRLDMQRANLRICTRAQNQQNQRKTRKITSSKYKGVCFYRPSKKWQANIGFQDIFGQNACMFLGTFPAEEEAAKAYDEAARRYFGEFAALNFPKEGERSCL